MTNDKPGLLGSVRTFVKEWLPRRASDIRLSLGSIPRASYLNFLCVAVIAGLAALIRILPLRWGFYLTEFDPYVNYRQAEYMVNNGFTSYFTWHDTMSWYPWGRPFITQAYPGVAMTAALLYLFLQSVGIQITLLDLCVLFPVILGTAACVALYLFSRDMWGRGVGIFSALFLAFNSAHIFRTSAGFFGDDTIGVFTVILAFYFYLRAISPERSLRSGIICSLLSGLSLAYLGAGWGAYRYALSLIPLFVFVLAIFGRYYGRLLWTYGITYGSAFLVMVQLPNLGYQALSEWTTYAIPGVFVILCGYEFFRRVKTNRIRLSGILAVLLFLIVGAFVLRQHHLISELGGKFWTVLYPSNRVDMPIVESVAENRMATWASIYHELGIYPLLALFGFYFAIQRHRNSDIFIIVFGLTTIYFGASLVRTSTIMAPAIALLAAIAVTQIATPAMDIIKEQVIFPKRKTRFTTKVGKEFGVAIMFVLLLIITPTFIAAVQSAYVPATIVTSSLPVVSNPPGDWLEALTWMKDNLPNNAVVLAWWDYGYWITTVGGKKTLTDNGTMNTTQISVTGRAFLSDLDTALPILKRYNVSDIALLVTWYNTNNTVHFYGFGEDSKWYWMARISNGSTLDGETVNYYAKRVGQGQGAYTRYDRILTVADKIVSNKTIVNNGGVSNSTLLGLLMSGAYSPVQGNEFFRPVFVSSNRFVLVYDVKYLTMTNMTLNLASMNVSFPEKEQLSGNLVDQESRPLGNRTVHLQSSEDQGRTWLSVKDVQTAGNGTYSYVWQPSIGGYLVRARWDGLPDKYASAISPYQPLNVTKGMPEVKLIVTPTIVGFGKNVSVDVRISPPLSEGQVTFETSKDNKTWVPTIVGQPAVGLFTPQWLPETAGVYYVRASWTGNAQYTAMTSKIVIVTVSKLVK